MEGRLWRTFAQRNARNAWSSIAACCSDWKLSSAKGIAAATELVNAILNHRYTSTMNLGVLHDMKGIREKAQEKLSLQQIEHLEALLDAYQELENITLKLIQASSMRVFAHSAGSPVAAFSKEKLIENDDGDGQGLPVFSALNVKCLEDLADEISTMYRSELTIKWLLASEFTSAVHQERRCLPLDGFPGLEFVPLHQKFLETASDMPRREVFEVYLACWLAEVKLNKQRIDEILFLVGEEMQVQLT